MINNIGTISLETDRLLLRQFRYDDSDDMLSNLLSEQTLPARYKDHSLSGQYKGFRECNIQPDWLLIYYKDENKLILTLTRTGTHADLFDL